MKFHPRWTATALIVVALGASSFAHAASVSGQGTWETTLQGRDLDGNLATAEAWYDTALNITWLADANYVRTSRTWTNANAWAAGINLYGITGWRLPTVTDVGNDGCTYTNLYQGVDCGYNITTQGEMSHLFYTTLGNLALYNTAGSPQAGSGLTNTGPFSNVRPSIYWSATEYATNTSYAWVFYFNNGLQSGYVKTDSYWAWAVHAGDVGAAVSSVPVPAAAWLFGSGIAGLIGFARRRSA